MEELEGAAGVDGGAVACGPDDGVAAGVGNGGDEGRRRGGDESEGESVARRRPILV